MESRSRSVASNIRWVAFLLIGLSPVVPALGQRAAPSAGGAGTTPAATPATGSGGGGSASMGGGRGGRRGGYGVPAIVGPSPVLFIPIPYPYVEPSIPVRVPTAPGGLMLPAPGAVPFGAPAPQPQARPVAARRPDPNRSAELLTMGDRLFRGANFKKAEERYLQAAKADPNSASPHLRLAQLALVRGQFAKAAAHLRTTQTVDPGWLVNAPDIQRLYAEPEDFAKILAKLETQVQAHPDDRDAWFVLGAQLFLSGRVDRARDVFTRLADRKLDETLAAFLDASTPPDKQAP